MKIFIVLASVALAINAASDRELWQEFKLNHGKTYRNIMEEQVRFGIFQNNLRKIEQHNELYENKEKSYSLAVNKFADLSAEEFKNTYLTLKLTETPETQEVFQPTEGFQAPSSINWVSTGAVSAIKNQGQCGSCWTFSVTGALEGAYFIKHDQMVTFSEQDLLDCSTSYGTLGCNGGWMTDAFNFIRDNGIPTDSEYPYTARQGSCQNKQIFTKIQKYVAVAKNENSLQDAVATVGPVSVSIEADHFQFYSKGVFDEASCTHNIDHGVLVVGYDSQDGKDYWLVKNSWGADWGENGYVKMARNKNNQCGIADYVNYPVL